MIFIKIAFFVLTSLRNIFVESVNAVNGKKLTPVYQFERKHFQLFGTEDKHVYTLCQN